jgi:hypothetical protein
VRVRREAVHPGSNRIEFIIEARKVSDAAGPQPVTLHEKASFVLQ